MNDNDKTADAGDALQRIMEAEKQAAALIAKAREETGPSLIQAAYEESQRMRKEILEQAGTEAEALKRSVVEEARMEAGRIKHEGENEVSRIRSRAEPLMKRAVEETERRLAEFLKGGSD